MKLRVPRAGQYDYARIPGGGGQLGDNLDAALITKIEIEEDYVGLFPLSDRNSILSICRFAGDNHSGRAFDNEPQPGPNNTVVVD
jgi:hypothetical protein